MANNTSIGASPANNITVTTTLLYCNNTILNLTKILFDLQSLYSNNASNVSRFFNTVTIINYNCTAGVRSYFEQIITFLFTVGIQPQISLVSLYFNYLTSVSYLLNGFVIDREAFVNLSSITVNNTVQTGPCASADFVGESLCQLNSTNPVCNTYSNKWNYTCSQRPLTTQNPLNGTLGISTDLLYPTITSPILSPWQIGIVVGLSVLFALILLLCLGYVYRRYTHSKTVTISRVTLHDDIKLIRKTALPQVQAFQRTATVVQSRGNTPTVPSTNNGIIGKTAFNPKIYFTNPVSSALYTQAGFLDHTKVQDPRFASVIAPHPTKRIYKQQSPQSRGVTKVNSLKIRSRPVSGTSTTQLRSITGTLQENKLNDSDNISVTRSISSCQRKPSTPTSRQFTSSSIFDESLHDEDAWMSILDVVNAELANINEHGHTRVGTEKN